jgi:hypothetical protein
VSFRPDAPRHDGETDREGGECERRPQARPRSDERRDEDARREHDALALGVHRAREENSRGRKPPARRVTDPERDEQRSDDHEEVDEDVCERREHQHAEARNHENEEHGRPEQPYGNVAMEQAHDGSHGAHDQEPELHVQGGSVRSADGMERGRVDDGLERRIHRVRRRGEEVLVEPVEEVDRLALRNPERPGVVCLQALYPRRPKQRLEKDSRERNARRRHEHRPGRGGAPRPVMDGHATVSRQSGAGHGERDERDDDRRPVERDTDDEKRGPQHSERGQTDQVPEPDEPRHGIPRAESAEAPEERETDEGVREIERRKPGQPAQSHCGRLRIASWRAESSQTVCASG